MDTVDKNMSPNPKNTFLKHFVRHNKKLFGFILAMVPNHNDAEDILQETAYVLWNKFDEYELGTNFFAWAKRIAKNKVYEYYKKKRNLVQIDLDLLEKIQAFNEPVLGALEERMTALRGCLSKLEQKDMLLVQARFQQNMTLKEIAAKANESVYTLYRRMACIYVLLQVCVRKTLSMWGT
jgi:RNA polymerase sigma-70 factor (ECF subfamily)